MTRKTKRDLEKDVEDLADDTPTDDEPQTKAEAGITADFIRGANEEPQELPEGWTWEEHETSWGVETTSMVAVREDDQDGEERSDR
jgi:predicted phage tail protein